MVNSFSNGAFSFARGIRLSVIRIQFQPVPALRQAQDPLVGELVELVELAEGHKPRFSSCFANFSNHGDSGDRRPSLFSAYFVGFYMLNVKRLESAFLISTSTLNSPLTFDHKLLFRIIAPYFEASPFSIPIFVFIGHFFNYI